VPSARSLAAVLAAGASALLVAACADDSAGTGGRVPVVAAENFYGSILTQVGGRRVAVTSIIKDPSADPHEYTGTAQDTRAVAHAKLVVVNGVGYDSFMDRLLDAAPASGRKVIRVDQLVDAAGDDANPHLWYDPQNAARLAQAAARALGEADPRHAADYRRGAGAFVRGLDPLEHEIALLRRSFAGAPFAYTERVPQYLTDRIGLRLLTPRAFAKADEAGVDPPPQAVADMRALVTERRIKLLLYNPQASSSAAASLRSAAEGAGIPVVGVTETLPPHESYQHWQLGQMRAIGAALRRP
jgi:zinc/manganese transport system substrate-binding protein